MSKKEEEIPIKEEHLESSSVDSENNDSESNVSSEIDELKNQLETLKSQLEDEKNQHLRVYAEFENFRRRNARERIELIGSASLELMKELLPVLDDFERAIESNKKLEDLATVKHGFELLFQKMMRILNAKGLEALESKGETFDAEQHEAIAQLPVTEESDKGKILEVAEKGYKLNEKVIRHPKVVVGS